MTADLKIKLKQKKRNAYNKRKRKANPQIGLNKLAKQKAYIAKKEIITTTVI